MRVLRVLKRTLAVLAFVCMTLKIQLELRVLRAGRNTGGYSPWWGNETLGHLRAFPKLATKPNVTLSILRTLSIADQGFIPNKTGDRLVNTRIGSPLKDSSGNLPRVQHQQTNSESSSSYLKILSDATNKDSSVEAKSSGRDTASENPRVIEHTVMTTESPSNHKTRGGIFAKLRIYDGENTIDTDAIYFSHKREIDSDKTKTANRSKSISQSNVKQEGTSVIEEKPLIQENEKLKSATNGSSISLVVIPKIGNKTMPLPKKIKLSVLKGVSHDVDKHEMSLTKEQIADIKEELKHENKKQTVYNQESFGPILRNTTILLVQVHKRLENLRYLVASLRSVTGIQEAVVIFSHDFWDPAINAFVRNITEFRVMQMFFPLSIQLYPLVFPGRDPADCSWNTNTKGKETACLNANWPDSYGHYREASFTQIKHHWWWKIHRVFEGLKITQINYTGHVVFLEEDHYASPDLLHVLALMQRSRAALCPSCKVLALGNYNKMNPNIYKNFVDRGDWWVTKYNLGFAMDAAVWRILSRCKAHFCDFDDYNWDWTLTNVVQTCFPKRLPMLSLRLSRVLHVGSCGTHVRKKDCDVKGEVRTAVARLSASKQWLFPDAVVLQGAWKSSGKAKKGNGGWGDHRDKQLCRAIGNNTVDEATMSRLQAMTSL